MSQAYDPVKPQSGVTTFSQLYQIIRDHIAAAASQFSGTAFPSNPAAGQSCYRTDRLTTGGVPKVYVYTGLSSFGESGWVEVSSNSVIGEEVINARGSKLSLDQRLDVALNEDGTLKAGTTLNPSQWFLPSLTFTYLSTTSFTVNGDQRDIYRTARRLKINLGSSTSYTEVLAASYSATNTTVQTRDAALDATLVSVEHSIFLPATDAADFGKSAVSYRMLGQNARDYTVDTGTTDAYAVTLDPAPTQYFPGLEVTFKAANANTGPCTINVNGLGTRSITHNDGTALTTRNIPQNGIVSLRYNGSNFQLVGGACKDAPIGMVILYAGATAPDGFLMCDGSEISRSTYSPLFAVIGTTFGQGDGSTTFNIPDFRGVFPKGAGTTSRTAGKDAANNFYSGTLGAYSQDRFQGHRHSPLNNGGFVMNGSGSVVYTTGFRDTSAATTGDPATDTVNGTPRKGATTEPQSLGINFIIKY